MTPEQKAWIDHASYQELIDKVRQEPPDSEWFQGKLGEYTFTALMASVGSLCSQDEMSVARWQADFDEKNNES